MVETENEQLRENKKQRIDFFLDDFKILTQVFFFFFEETGLDTEAFILYKSASKCKITTNVSLKIIIQIINKLDDSFIFCTRQISRNKIVLAVVVQVNGFYKVS